MRARHGRDRRRIPVGAPEAPLLTGTLRAGPWRGQQAREARASVLPSLDRYRIVVSHPRGERRLTSSTASVWPCGRVTGAAVPRRRMSPGSAGTPLPRPTPSDGDGSGRDHAVLELARRRKERRRAHPKPGVERPAVSLSQRPRAGAPLARRRGPRQADGAAPDYEEATWRIPPVCITRGRSARRRAPKGASDRIGP